MNHRLSDSAKARPRDENGASFRARTPQEFREFFLSHVSHGDGCWEWHGTRHPSGYGVVSEPGKDRKRSFAHRVAYEMFVAPIPDGMHVLHVCDNPPCVRPDHLMVGSHAENMADKARKGRTRPVRPEFCSMGHRKDGPNLYSPPGRPGQRHCVACDRERHERSRARRRAAGLRVS